MRVGFCGVASLFSNNLIDLRLHIALADLRRGELSDAVLAVLSSLLVWRCFRLVDLELVLFAATKVSGLGSGDSTHVTLSCITRESLIATKSCKLLIGVRTLSMSVGTVSKS